MGDMADMELMNCFDEDEGLYFGSSYDFMYGRKHKPSGPGKCPICGQVTILKNGKFGTFYGCYAFPECKGSRSSR